MIQNTLWVEKYRPQAIDDCILPDDIKASFKAFVEKDDLPNMLLTGKPGMGKTTIAKALCNQLNCDVMVINGSDEGRTIDTLREKLKSFASTVSLSGGKKVIIIDEADYMNAQSVQPALRNFMEEFSANCRFILTCNFKMKIIDPLISRCTVFEFNIPSSQKTKLAAQLMKRISSILEEEGVEFDKKVVAEVIMKFYPDFRKTISEFQRYSTQRGKIDVGILASIEDVSIKELVRSLKEKDFSSMRKWVNENLDNDPTMIIRTVFDSLEENLEPASIPQAIIILGDYAYKSAFVADHELNLSAMFIMLMAECTWR